MLAMRCLLINKKKILSDMKIQIVLLFSVLFLISSCKSSYWYTDIHPEKVAFRDVDNLEFTEDEEKDVAIRTAFVGQAIDYSIFQVEIENLTDQPMSISYDDVRLVHSNGFQRNAHHKYNFIKNLNEEKKDLKKEKRVRTIGNILLGGLTIAGIAAGGGGANSVNAIAYGAESAIYIADDARAFNAMEGSIEDEIAYIKEWVLFESIVPSGEALSKDVIFPNQDFKDDFDIEIKLDGKRYLIPYECVLKEGER